MSMFFTEEKIHKRIEELEPYRYYERQAIKEWEMLKDDTGREKYPPLDANWHSIEIGQKWNEINSYYWLKSRVQIPDVENDVLLLFNLGLPGNLKQTGFEGLVFINNTPYQGIDSNHEEIFLKKIFKGKKVNILIKLWTGMYGRHGNLNCPLEHEFLLADMAILNKKTDNLYFVAKNLIETIELMPQNSEIRVELLKELDKAIDHLDWQEPGSKSFYKTCEESSEILNDYLSTCDKKTKINITAVGHTHIDVAWLWQIKHTREKIVRSFLTVLRLMEKYPEYRFFQSSPQIYQFIKEDYPEVYAQIKRRIKEGRWEIDGGMWLEADCNIPSGESLVRQLLFGSKFMKKEFDKSPTFLWLPDVFGYSWALPQILKKSGLNTFMTTKISWNEYNRMPHDTFMWKGIDGTEILTHFITTPDPGKMKDNPGSWFYTYNGLMNPATVKGMYDMYSDKVLNNSLLLAYGYGDGGGGVNRSMLESRRIIDKIPGLPHVKPGTAKSFFNILHQNVDKTDQYMPIWDGELYLEFHRGTYTSQAYMKKMNRFLELNYRELEFESILKKVSEKKWLYPQDSLNSGWQIILRNQFHDIIPGSSINEVYKDSFIEYKHALKISENINKSLNSQVSGTVSEEVYTVINSAGWSRSGIIKITGINKIGQFETFEGKKLLSEKTLCGYDVFIPHIPALGIERIKFNSKSIIKIDSQTATISDNYLETKFYKLKWNSNGQIISLYDKLNNRKVLLDNCLSNAIEIYEDKPRDYDAWNIDIYSLKKKTILTANFIKIITNNSLKVVVQFNYTYHSSSIKQYMILYSTNKRIDFKTKVNWHERQKLLKTSFSADIRATQARYQIQFGNLLRQTTWNTSWDWAKFEVIGHQWADLSENNYGVALLNDSKYGYSVKENKMRLTLLKGAISPDPKADIGIHTFTYSLFPHCGNFVEGKVEENAWALNKELTCKKGLYFGKIKELFDLPAEQVLSIDAIKKAEDSNDIIVRFHDHTGGKRKINMNPKFNFSGWMEVDLMERKKNGVQWNKKSKITFELSPYEIKTIEFRID